MCKTKYIHPLFASQFLWKIKTAPKPRSFGADGDCFLFFIVMSHYAFFSLPVQLIFSESAEVEDYSFRTIG